MWSVSCTYANQIAPPSTQATMQSILESLHWGLGSGCGALLGGALYDRYGATALFQICAVMSACSTVIAMLMSCVVRDSVILEDGGLEMKGPNGLRHEPIPQFDIDDDNVLL